MQFNKIFRSKKHFADFAVRILSGFFWILMLFGFDEGGSAALTVSAALLHELGHCAALFIIGAGATLPHASLRGFGLLPRRLLSYKEDIFVCAAGPTINLITAAVALSIGRPPASRLFALISLFCAVSNLLPVRGYDGFRILSSLFALLGSYRAIRVLDAVSFATATLAVLLSLCAIYFFDAGYWIFGVFFIFLLGEVKNSLERRF